MRTQPEKQLNMDNYKITERKGHHKPNSQRYPDRCGCEESTGGGYAYKDKVAESTNKEAEWDKIRFYHQAPVVKKKNNLIKVDTHGYGTKRTTRERINTELPRGFRIVQRDREVKLKTPEGLKDVPEKFTIETDGVEPIMVEA